MKRVLVNTSSNVLLLVLKTAITFIMTPIILRALGSYDYGIWEMVQATAGYMGLMEMGLRPAISRYTARFAGLQDVDGLQMLFSTALLLLGAVGGAAVTFFVGWALLWPGGLTPEGGEVARYSLFLIIIGLQLMIAFPGHVAESVLEGLQRYSLKNNVIIINSILGSTVTYYFIDRFDPLLFLALVTSIGITCKYLLFFYFVYVGTKGLLRVSVSYRSYGFLREILGFSGKSFVQSAATSLESYAPAVIVGAIFGPASVVFYALPFALVRHLRNLGWTLTHAFMPVFSDLHARGEHERMKQMYLQASRAVIAIIAPAAVMIVMLGPDFLSRWVGPQYIVHAEVIIPMIVFSLLLPFLNPFAGRYLTAIGQHGILAKISTASAIVNVLASVAFAFWLGIVGVAVGALLPVMLSVPIVTWVVGQRIGVGGLGYVRQAVLPIVVPILVLGIVMWSLKMVFFPSSYARMATIALMGGVSYGLVFFLLGVSNDERRVATRWVGRCWLRVKTG